MPPSQTLQALMIVRPGTYWSKHYICENPAKIHCPITFVLTLPANEEIGFRFRHMHLIHRYMIVLVRLCVQRKGAADADAAMMIFRMCWCVWTINHC